MTERDHASATTPTSSTSPGEPQAQTAGDLTARREAMRLSLPDIAQRLRLHPRQIEALERGDWASLPGPAFVRGALRSYGRMIGIDVTPLLSQVGGAAEVLRPTGNLGKPMPRRGAFPLDGSAARRGSWLWWILTAIVAAVVLVLFFGRDGDLSQVRSWVGEGGAAGPGTAAPAGAFPAATGSGNVAPAPGPGSGAAEAEPSPGAGPPAQGSMSPPPAGSPSGPASGAAVPGGTPPPLVPLSPQGDAAPAAGGTTILSGAPGSVAPLRMRFAQDAWVELRGPDGKAVFAGFGRAGEQREFDVAGPVSLTVGNANHVDLAWRGQPVDLKARARDSVARLRLE